MRKLKYVATASLLFGACLFVGQACRDIAGFSATTETSEANVDVASNAEPGGGSNEVPVPADLKAIETYRVAHTQEMIPAATAALSIPRSTTLYSSYTSAAPNLSADGAPDSVSAPLWNSVVTFSGTACNEAVMKEKAATEDLRVLFKGWNFSKNPQSQTSGVVDQTINTLARRAWLRDETDEERKMIQDGLSLFQTTVVDDTAKQALFLCTVMMASLDAQVR